MRPQAGSGTPPPGSGTADPDPAEAVAIWLGVTPTGAELEHLPLERFHQAIDQLQADTVPESYWRKVIDSRRASRTRNPTSERPA